MKKIPVILDTDIGTDIDDQWALAYLLRCPELDLKMILTDTGDTIYRAEVAAKMLIAADRQDVEIGIGIPFEDNQKFMQEWLNGFSIDKYRGKVYKDGVKAFVDFVMSSNEPVTLICISAMPNIAAALTIEPRIAEKIRFVGMQGSIYKGYDGKGTPDAEANVKYHNDACVKVFNTLKDITITPLDTCGIVRLNGEQYKKILKCEDPLIKSVIDSYRIWRKNVTWYVDCNPEFNTSVLFDTVAVYLAYEEKLLDIKDIKIKITPDGMTIPDEKGIKVRAALKWKDINKFKEMLVKRLIKK